MDQPREEALFISVFKKDREKQYNQFMKSRKLRLRSAVFELPEFEDSPLVSVAIFLNSEDQVQRAETFIKKYKANTDVQIAISCSDNPAVVKTQLLAHFQNYADINSNNFVAVAA